MDETFRTGTIGFVGTGEIAKAMVKGLARVPDRQGRLIVSPRNAEVSAELARTIDVVSVAEDNQGVVDAADIVVLSVRPDQLDSLQGLTFRDDQLIVSVLAGVSIDDVQRTLGTAATVVRAVPLPPVRHREGVTVVVPSHPVAVEMFDALGGTTVLADEARMPVFVTLTGACSAFFQYVDSLASWAADRGAPEQEVQTFARAMVASLAPSLVHDSGDISQLVRSCETPGGLNEQLRRTFFDDATTTHLRDALDGVLQRLTE